MVNSCDNRQSECKLCWGKKTQSHYGELWLTLLCAIRAALIFIPVMWAPAWSCTTGTISQSQILVKTHEREHGCMNRSHRAALQNGTPDSDQ